MIFGFETCLPARYASEGNLNPVKTSLNHTPLKWNMDPSRKGHLHLAKGHLDYSHYASGRACPSFKGKAILSNQYFRSYMSESGKVPLK
jgi:hypothetical protein